MADPLKDALSTEDREVIERLAQQLWVALDLVSRDHFGTWRGNAGRALDAARERGLTDA